MGNHIDAAPDTLWLTLPSADLLAAFASGEEGLTGDDAARRLRRDGPNSIAARAGRRILTAFLSRFGNPLVLLLLAAAAISAVTGNATSFVIIIVMVLLSVTIDFVQEHRAEHAAEHLKKLVAARAMVLRDGAQVSVPAADLVCGDVVQLAVGSIVPADCRLIAARNFFVNEALLTGEPYPVAKQSCARPDASADPLQAKHAVFQGSSVISGSATALVCRTGGRTAFGAIATSLDVQQPPTAFELGTRRFGFLIVRMTFFLLLFVLLVQGLYQRPMLESLLFALALAVGLTPELLPMVVSVTLARGAMRMARAHVIVKRLSAIHDFGSMDVLCTDKTGTLTEAQIRLERHVDADGHPSDRVRELAFLNSYFETGLKSPLDDAILAHAAIDTTGWRKIDEVPFDFERRRVSVLLENAGCRTLIVKGAPEELLRLAREYEVDNGRERRALHQNARDAAAAQFERLSAKGLRVLGVAWREVPDGDVHAQVNDESALVLAGFVAFLDPPKRDAASAIAALARSGVVVKIVTGDNAFVTRHLCEQISLPVTGVLNGSELDALDDAALQAKAAAANLFCRVSPVQKSRIISALQQRGHVVGYLGDGVNDAPPLRAADVGISVDHAVDVARDAADMILLRHDLGVLHRGIIEGRRTHGNILKYIMMGTSSSFGNMFSMAGAALFLPFLPMLPIQILLNNLLYDVSEIAIPFDKVDANEMLTPQRWDMDFIRRFMFTLGPVSSAFDFLTFYFMLVVLEAGEALFQTGWFIESLTTQVLVIFVIRTHGNPLKSRPHRWLAATSLTIVAIGVALPFLPFAGMFGFVEPPATFLLLLALLACVYLCCAQWAKRWFYRREHQRARACRPSPGRVAQ